MMYSDQKIINAMQIVKETNQDILDIIPKYATIRYENYEEMLDINYKESNFSSDYGWRQFSKGDLSDAEIEIQYNNDKTEITCVIVTLEEWKYGESYVWRISVPWNVITDFTNWKEEFIKSRVEKQKEIQKKNAEERKYRKMLKEEAERAEYLRLKAKFEQKKDNQNG